MENEPKSIDPTDWVCPKHGVQATTLGDLIGDGATFWPYCHACILEKLEDLGVERLQKVKKSSQST
jgi:hypothetical protein